MYVSSLPTHSTISSHHMVVPNSCEGGRHHPPGLGHSATSTTGPPRVRPRHVQRLLHVGVSCAYKPDYVRHLEGKAVVIDVGAHHGEELAGYKGLVSKLLAFEASPSKLIRIKDAVARADMEDVVTVTHAAVSNRTGVAHFHTASTQGSQQDTFGAVGHMNPGKTVDVEVPVVMLDNVIDEHVDLLKIDTQGHELLVLKGAEGLIRKWGIDMLHLEFSPSLTVGHGYNASDLLEYVYSLDYTCFSCDTGSEFGPPHLRPSPNKSWGFKEFEEGFKPWAEVGIPGHGTWADLICV